MNMIVEEAKQQVANNCCEGSNHNHELIAGLLAEIERLRLENDELGERLAQFVKTAGAIDE